MNATTLMMLLQFLSYEQGSETRQSNGFALPPQRPLSSTQYTDPVVITGRNPNNQYGSLNPYGSSHRRPLNSRYIPTQQPLFRPPVSYNGRMIIREYLKFGVSSLVEGCNVGKRIPCTNLPVSWNTCLRWKCCWDASSSVPCAKNTYYITSLKERDFGECGIQSVVNLTVKIINPPILPLLFSQIHGRIIGGTETIDKNWPWMVYLYIIQNGIVNGGICGGTLLNNQWVMTAAHCIQFFNQPSLYGVILGEHVISRMSGNEVFRTVTRLERSPLYNSFTFEYDVALLKLNESVQFNDYIRPGCLVASGTRTDDTNPPSFAGTECFTLGWGLTSSPGGIKSDILMQLNITITPRIICILTTLTNASVYDGRVVTQNDTQFCAGGLLNQDPCIGDSGGPLMCPGSDGRFYVHGMTSFGADPCGQAGLPGVYTKLSNPVLNSFVTSTIAT